MTVASRIIDRFGGTRKMARILGLPRSTVDSWKRSGLIPAKRQKTVFDAAREQSIDIDPADMIEDRDG